MLFEGLGLGGASGPLTVRYLPPFGGSTYFLRPNTIKVPFFPGVPIIGSDRRGIVDIALYVAMIGFLIRILIAPAVTVELIVPLLILMPIIGLLDKTIYFAARSDIYYPMMLALVFANEPGNALKIVWFAIWFWAAFSKLTPVFSGVVMVMLTNSPVLRHKMFLPFKKMLVKDYENDLRPSPLGNTIAHIGTAVEFSMPILMIVFNDNPRLVMIPLLVISSFHLFIFLNFPLAVPLEWNVIMVFGGWLLFYAHPEWSVFQVTSPAVIVSLAIMLLVIPIVGHVAPKYVSFLMSMRYYAGTWAYSIWFFKGDAKDKIDQNITKTSAAVEKQLELFYKPKLIEAIMSRVISFRLLHLPSRALHKLVPLATDNRRHDYLWVEGEFLAGELIGWNFGDGHLHNEPVLESVQKRCNYESGELRVIMVESPKLHNGQMEWRVLDAKDGLLHQGVTDLNSLKDELPWPKE